MADDIASSPSATTRKALSLATVIPLDSPSRIRPIDPSLPNVKVPDSATLPVTHYHPVTCEALTAEDLAYHKFGSLRAQFGSPEAAARAREEAVREVRARIEEGEKRAREVEKEMEEMEKMREVERRAFQSMKKS